MEKKKETKKPIKKTTKKLVNKTTTKKTNKNNKKKKGFTLIELLAVIIILGILMIIAIPSVTRYISDSRKSSYVDTAKEIVGGARNLVNEGKLGMYDTNSTYYIPVSCIKTENALKSPYGDFEEDGAYVGVIYDGKGYQYYWISVDDAGQGVKNITRIDKLDTDSIESDLKKSDIQDIIETTGIGNRTTINILNCKNDSWSPIILSNTSHNVSEEGGAKPDLTAAQEIGVLTELKEIAGAKRFVGPYPKNYISFNDSLWRIIGVYGDNLKIILLGSSDSKYYSVASNLNKWDGSLAQSNLNDGFYTYFLSDISKQMIEENAVWYTGLSWYNYTAPNAYTAAQTDTWIGKIGLIATYEYMYATNDESCYSVNGYSYDNSTTQCGKSSKNWLSPNNTEWTINGASNNSTNRTCIISSSSYIYDDIVNNTHSIYPVVYLKSSVKITGGTGTYSDPYTLGL